LALLEEIKENANYSRPTLDKLEGVMEEDKCLVGESFLNDLVNYYNFKDIKEHIEYVKKHIEYAGYDSKDGVKRKILLKNLDELINAVGKLDENNIGSSIYISSENDDVANTDLTGNMKKIGEAYNKTMAFVKNKIKTDVSKIYDNFKTSAENYELIFDKLSTRKTSSQSVYTAKIQEFATFLVNYDYIETDKLRDKIIEYINLVLTETQGTKEHLVMFLKALKVVLLYEDSQSAIMELFNKYIKICKRNIGKYDDLFSKNDISNIDDVFMIKSYATFLHKLETLKKNLESKDQTKLERALTNALERLFDLYGINDTDAIINDPKSHFYDRLLL
jgi:hypothetical protein